MNNKLRCPVKGCKGLAEIPVRENEEVDFSWICRDHVKILINSFVTNRIAFQIDGRLATDLVG